MLDPDVGRNVRFVFGLGGYYDLREVVNFYATGWIDPPGPMRCRMEADPYARWVLLNSMIPELDDPSDRNALQDMVRRKLDDFDASIQDLAKGLSPRAQALLTLLTGPLEPQEEVDALLAKLPAGVHEYLADLNLATANLADFRPNAILLHSRNDPIFPYSQSLKLAEALPDARALISEFGHVEFRRIAPEDVLPALRAVDLLLEQRKSGQRRLPAQSSRSIPSPCAQSSC